MRRDPTSNRVPARLVRASIVVFTVAAAAPLGAARWFVPGAAHSPGVGSAFWRTDLILANPGSVPVTATVRLLRAGADNSRLPDPVSLAVPAGGQVVNQDVVATLLGGEGSGALLVESPADGLLVSSRTYNARADRIYGMLLPGLPEDQAIPPGEKGHLIWAAGSGSLRTNVGFAGTTGRTGSVTLQVRGTSGQLLGSVTRALLPYGQTQVNDVVASVGAVPTDVARVEVTGTVPLLAFASTIDGQTGDPFATVAQRARDGASELVLASSAHADGGGASRFRTDLRLFNLSGWEVAVRLAFYPRGESTAAPESVDVTLAGGELKALEDVLLSSFGKEAAAGALTISSPRSLLAVSRTYDRTDAGTAGLGLPAVSRLGLVEPADTAVLPFVSDSGFRTNVIFFLPGAGSIATLTLKGDDGGTLASRDVELPADSMQQIDDVFGWLGVPGVSGTMEVRSAGGGKYWVVATVIDESSNDPIHVGPAVRRALPDGCVRIAWPWGGLELTYLYDATSTDPKRVSWSFDRVTETVTNTLQNQGGAVAFFSGETYRILDSGPLRGFRELGESWGGTVSTTRWTEGRSYSPALLTGPWTTWCPGVTWNAPSVQMTVTDPFYGGSVSQTAPETGEVVAVEEPLILSISTAPGLEPAPVTFRTVHRKTTRPEGSGTSTTEAWISMEHGIVVKQVTTGASGASSTSVLTALY